MKVQISIKQYILAFSVIAVLVPAGLIGYLSYRNSQSSIEKMVKVDLSSQMTSLSNSLSYFLSTSQKTNEIVAKMISIGEMNLGRSDPFAKVLMEYLKSDPNIMSVEFANKNNESVGVARDIFDNDFAVGISGRRTNYSYNLYSVDDYTNLRSVVWTSPAYDSRLRPWYLQALEAGKPTGRWPDLPQGTEMAVRPAKLAGIVKISSR